MYPRWIPYRYLKSFTNGFSEENFIGKFQFGKVYRGIWKHIYRDDNDRTWRDLEVVVKIWEDPLIYKVCPGDIQERFRDEKRLLERFYFVKPTNVARLIAFWSEGDQCAFVYMIKPLDALNNLIPKESFSWLQRIMVAFRFAFVLEFMHSNKPVPYLIRNLDAAHIMVDKDYNPILFDFSMISGGILIDRKDLLNQYVHGCYGYVDPSLSQGGWSEKCDVFAYGVLLLGLIMKRVYTDEDRINNAPFIYEVANSMYNSNDKSTLVHQRLESEPFFYSTDGIHITKLALLCVDYNPRKRPTMKQVVECLQNLCIASHHAEALGMSRVGGISETQKDKPSGLFCKYFHHEQILNKELRKPTIIQAGKECEMMRILSSADLSFITNGFSEENFIGNIQFGRVYHGEMEGRKVIVKTWDKDNEHLFNIHTGELEERLRDELVLLRHPTLVSHPNLVSLIGYCYEERCLGVVYDLNPLNSVHNLLLKDTFTWSKRIKVALGLATLLNFLHNQYVVNNIAAAHIMVDQEYNPKLIDFGMFAGGILPESRKPRRHKFVRGSEGYTDGRCSGIDCDIFSFGVLLIALIAKKVPGADETKDEEPYLHYLVQCEYNAKLLISGFNKSEFSLVHESLEQDPAFCSSDGIAVTKLAMQCVERPYQRPALKDIVRTLLKLRIIKTLQMLRTFQH